MNPQMQAIQNLFKLSAEDCARLVKCHPRTIEKLKSGEIDLPQILPEIERRMKAKADGENLRKLQEG